MAAESKDNAFKPAYLELESKNKLKTVADKVKNMLVSCRLCPRECSVNRLENEIGYCSIGKKAVVSSAFAHRGEERPISGSRGSGTIFFSGCNLKCVFCQNFSVSHQLQGEKISSSSLARQMIHLQKINCHNINFVTPSHVIPQLLMALAKAAKQGLNIPLVYNCGGYEKIETLELVKNIFDIYMPDFKFWDPQLSEKYLNAPDYPEKVRRAIKWMDNKAGKLKLDEQNIARRGVLIRHLVMPGAVEDSKKILEWIKNELSENTYVNIMPQYRPAGKISDCPELQRSLRTEEYRRVQAYARKIGLNRLG